MGRTKEEKCVSSTVFLFVLSVFSSPQLCFAQDDSHSQSDGVGVYNDPSDSVPFEEDAFVEESVPDLSSPVERIELTTEKEQSDYYLNVALPEECNPDLDSSCLETEDGCGSYNGGPQYYTNYPTVCDDSRTNWVRIKAGTDGRAGSSGSIWMCLGKHYQSYTYPAPDYARPETIFYYSSIPDNMDAACINLGQAPSAAGNEVYYNFCNSTTWNDFFSWLEPDDWDDLRFFFGSSDGAQIAEIEIMLNGQQIYLETGINTWLDLYYGRQLFLDWRIAKYRHDLVAAVVGTSYLNPILEVAAQDLGQSGARKYNGDDNAWCSEFAVYAMQNGSRLSSPCAGIPTPLETGDIGVGAIYTWLNACGRVLDYSTITADPSLLQPGYYISINNRGHSMIFAGWVSTVGGMMWVVDGNGEPNTVRLRQRSFTAFLATDFVGNTF